MTGCACYPPTTTTVPPTTTTVPPTTTTVPVTTTTVAVTTTLPPVTTTTVATDIGTPITVVPDPVPEFVTLTSEPRTTLPMTGTAETVGGIILGTSLLGAGALLTYVTRKARR